MPKLQSTAKSKNSWELMLESKKVYIMSHTLVYIFFYSHYSAGRLKLKTKDIGH